MIAKYTIPPALWVLTACAGANSPEVQAFENAYNSVCGFATEPISFTDLVGEGRVEMTGRYLLDVNQATLLRETGRIDISFDTFDRDEVIRGKEEITVSPIEFSEVVGFLAGGLPQTAWEIDQTALVAGKGPTIGTVSAFNPLRGPAFDQSLEIKARGARVEVTRDGSDGARRVFDVEFAGTFKDETSPRSGPLAVCGTIIDASIPGAENGKFFLEEVR